MSSLFPFYNTVYVFGEVVTLAPIYLVEKAANYYVDLSGGKTNGHQKSSFLHQMEMKF